MRPYTELSGLEEIVLEESFVLGIRAEPSEVVFEMDFALTRQHEQYSAPSASERECFVRGQLRFNRVGHLTWRGQTDIRPAIDATGERDYGHIDTFEWDGESFVASGDWGVMELQASAVEIDLAAAG